MTVPARGVRQTLFLRAAGAAILENLMELVIITVVAEGAKT